MRSMCGTSNLLNSYVTTLTDDSHTDETPLSDTNAIVLAAIALHKQNNEDYLELE